MFLLINFCIYFKCLDHLQILKDLFSKSLLETGTKEIEEKQIIFFIIIINSKKQQYGEYTGTGHLCNPLGKQGGKKDQGMSSLLTSGKQCFNSNLCDRYCLRQCYPNYIATKSHLNAKKSNKIIRQLINMYLHQSQVNFMTWFIYLVKYTQND